MFIPSGFQSCVFRGISPANGSDPHQVPDHSGYLRNWPARLATIRPRKAGSGVCRKDATSARTTGTDQDSSARFRAFSRRRASRRAARIAASSGKPSRRIAVRIDHAANRSGSPRTASKGAIARVSPIAPKAMAASRRTDGSRSTSNARSASTAPRSARMPELPGGLKTDRR